MLWRFSTVAELSLLGPGKTNYPAVTKLADELTPVVLTSDEHAEQDTGAASP